jgi:hypothetical protein
MCIERGDEVDLPFPETREDMTIDEIRRLLEAYAWEGCHCPACGANSKIYRRVFHAAMGRFLVRLVNASAEGEFLESREFLPSGEKASSDASYLVHWKLVERPEVGLYRATKLGRRFVHDHSTRVAPAYWMFNNRPIGPVAGSVNIEEVLGTQFSFDELMRG